MIEWKEACRHYRYMLGLSRKLEIDLKRRLFQEHTKRVTLVNAMTHLLPIMARGQNSRMCYVCKVVNGHVVGCAYIQALEAVAEASKSID